MKGLIWAAAVALSAAPLAAQPAPVRASTQNASLDAAFDRMVGELGLPGAALMVVDRNGIVYQRTAGNTAVDRPVPVASATKWLSAALIMTLVDDGKLRLETKVGEVLTDAPQPIRNATVRQLFSHTAGTGGGELLALRDVSSTEDAVRKVFANGVERPPGASFAYGGTSMQIGGLMAERLTGTAWQTLFDRRIAQPLGFTGHRWGWLRPTGAAEVPLIGGGLTVSPRDFAAFLRMILNDGRVGQRQLLSPASVAAIESDQLRGLPSRFRPQTTPDNWSYGLGIWCERKEANGRCLVSSSAGAFGTYPWIDRERGLAGVFVTLGRFDQVLAKAVQLREQATATLSRRQ